MGFSTCSMVVDDVHFHLFLFSLWLIVIECDCCDDIEWVRMNGSCLLKDETEFDNLFFLFFSAMMKTIKEWNLIRFVFHFADFADCYQFSQNEINRHSFWIVIWESVILIKLVEMIEISTAFAKHVLNLFCFLSSFWFEDCWKGEMWKEVWNLLVRNNWWNSRKKEKKSVIFRICQTGWNSLAIGLAECLKLVAIKQTTEIQQNKRRFQQQQNSIFFFFFQRVREMRFSLVVQIIRHFSNEIFESRSI